MVISQPPRNNRFHIIIVLHNALPQLLWMLPRDTLCSCYNYNIEVTHRNGAVSIFFTNQIHGGSSADCSLFILSLHALALHLAVKILLQIFLYEDFRHVSLTYICQLYFLRMPAGPHFCYIANTIKWKHSNICTSLTKHKEVRPDWNDKNDNANYAPRITWKVLPMAQVAIFKEIFDQVRKDLDCELFYSELKRLTSHIIFTIR